MNTYKVVFIKNGLKYETYWQALSVEDCIEGIENLFTSKADYSSENPQNCVMSVEEMPNIEDKNVEWEDTFGPDYEAEQ